MNEWEWIQVVSDVYSTQNYAKNQNEQFEHYFAVEYEDNQLIRLLRIDIADKFYLKDFKLIYLETGETIQGNIVEDSFTFRFVWLPRKGKYKIESRGGKYRYSVLMLDSTLKFTAEPICEARSPFNILVSCKVKDKALYKLVAFRKVGTTEWRVAEPSVKKVLLDVDPISAYEIKMKLVIPDMYESEYSPTIVTTEHQTWANQFEIDPDFFNTTLLFLIKYRIWLDNVSIALKCTTHSIPEKCWTEDPQEPPEKTEKWISEQEITWDMGSRLFDILVKDDLTLDWQLVFKNTKTNQIAESKVRTIQLQKRHAIIRGENSFNFLTKFSESRKELYLCGDGQFWYQRKTKNSSGVKTNFKGNFILERQDPEDKRSFSITLMPKFKKIEQKNIKLDQLSITLLPELVKIILSYVASPPEVEPRISLNLVCKHWFNIFADGMWRIRGEYRIGGRRRGGLNFHGWNSFHAFGYLLRNCTIDEE